MRKQRIHRWERSTYLKTLNFAFGYDNLFIKIRFEAGSIENGERSCEIRAEYEHELYKSIKKNREKLALSSEKQIIEWKTANLPLPPKKIPPTKSPSPESVRSSSIGSGNLSAGEIIQITNRAAKWKTKAEPSSSALNRKPQWRHIWPPSSLNTQLHFVFPPLVLLHRYHRHDSSSPFSSFPLETRRPKGEEGWVEWPGQGGLAYPRWIYTPFNPV